MLLSFIRAIVGPTLALSAAVAVYTVGDWINARRPHPKRQ